MSDKKEEEIIEYESARNECVDAFFNARPHIKRTNENEFLVESGFRLAYNYFVEGVRHE